MLVQQPMNHLTRQPQLSPTPKLHILPLILLLIRQARVRLNLLDDALDQLIALQVLSQDLG